MELAFHRVSRWKLQTKGKRQRSGTVTEKNKMAALLEELSRVRPFPVRSSRTIGLSCIWLLYRRIEKRRKKLGADVSCKRNRFEVRSFPKSRWQTFETSVSSVNAEEIVDYNGEKERKGWKCWIKKEVDGRENKLARKRLDFGTCARRHANVGALQARVRRE